MSVIKYAPVKKITKNFFKWLENHATNINLA